MENNQLLETWQIHCRINLYILNAIALEAFATEPPIKGRGFAQMFAHIHNTRLMWLQSAAPDLLNGLVKFENSIISKSALQVSLKASAEAIEEMLNRAIASDGKIKGFKPHLPAFVGYLISHESYHHGEIGIELTRIGFPLDKKTSFGIWEWGSR